MKKTEHITVRVTAEQKKTLLRSKGELSTSTYIRYKLFGEEKQSD